MLYRFSKIRSEIRKGGIVDFHLAACLAIICSEMLPVLRVFCYLYQMLEFAVN